MSAFVSVSETSTMAVLGLFLQSILPSTCEIVRGQINRVPEPRSNDWLQMQPIMRKRLSTNVTSYADYYPGSGVRYDLVPTEYTVQLDVHGPNAADNAQIITSLFRSDLACDNFNAASLTLGMVSAGNTLLTDQNGNPLDVTSLVDMQPLYNSEARELVFTNGERQFEFRWSIDAVMQINPVIVSTQQFAAALAIGLIEIDARYPP